LLEERDKLLEKMRKYPDGELKYYICYMKGNKYRFIWSEPLEAVKANFLRP
jgi:hypothetical protein